MTSLIPKISVLSPRVIRVLGCNPGPMTLQGTNTYIIGTGKRRILLDTGEDNNQEYIELLKSVILENKITLEKIIISHWHHDHIGGLSNILQNFKGMSTIILKYPRYDVHKETGDDVLKFIKDKDEHMVEGATLRLHHTPGHTTDHIIAELDEEVSVFSGDCILGEGTAVFEDLYSYMNSLNIILSLKPKRIYPGHGPVLENPVDVLNFYITHRNERERQILEVLTVNSPNAFSPLELVQEIYKELHFSLHQAAANNVSHHLRKLLKEKKVNLIEDNKWKLFPVGSSL